MDGDFHVPANFIGYGEFLFSAMTGIGYLLRTKGFWKDCLPDATVLDLLIYRTIAIGFTFFGVNFLLSGMHSYGNF